MVELGVGRLELRETHWSDFHVREVVNIAANRGFERLLHKLSGQPTPLLEQTFCLSRAVIQPKGASSAQLSLRLTEL